MPINRQGFNGKAELAKQQRRATAHTHSDRDMRVALQNSGAMQYEQLDYRFDDVIRHTAYDEADFIRVYTFERNGVHVEAYGMTEDGSIHQIIENDTTGDTQHLLHQAMEETEE